MNEVSAEVAQRRVTGKRICTGLGVKRKCDVFREGKNSSIRAVIELYSRNSPWGGYSVTYLTNSRRLCRSTATELIRSSTVL